MPRVIPSLEIGKPREDELEWAASLMAGSEPWITLDRGLDACREACRRTDLRAFVARQGAAPLGFVLVHPRGVAGSPYIASIGVAPEARGRKVGRRLMAFVEDLFRPQSRHIFLCVSSFNGRAQKFYEDLGYARVGEFPDYVVDGASEILMHKWLRRS